MLVGHAVDDDSIDILVHVENIASVVLDLEVLLDRLMVRLLLLSNDCIEVLGAITAGLVLEVLEFLTKVTRFLEKLNEGVASLCFSHVILKDKAVVLISKHFSFSAESGTSLRVRSSGRPSYATPIERSSRVVRVTASSSSVVVMPHDCRYNFLNRLIRIEDLRRSSYHFITKCLRIRVTLPGIVPAKLVGDAVGSVSNAPGFPLEVLLPTTRLLREIHVVVVVEVEVVDLVRVDHVAHLRKLLEGAVIRVLDGEQN